MVIIKNKNDITTVSIIDVNKNTINIKKIIHFTDINSSINFLKKSNKAIYVSYDLDFISETITLPKNIKSERSIQQIINSKLNNSYKKNEKYIIFNLEKQESSFNENDIEYKIEASTEQSLTNSISKYPGINISKIVLPHMAIFSMLKFFRKNETFLFIFVSMNINYYLLINNGNLVFYRTGELSNNTSDFNTTLSDVEQTISYIKTSYRDYVFEKVLIIDTVSNDEINILDSLSNRYDFLKFEIFNDFPLNTSNDKFDLSLYFVDICAAFSTKNTAFIPVQYKQSQNISYFLTVGLVFSFLYLLNNLYFFNKNLEIFTYEKKQNERNIALLKSEEKKIINIPNDIFTYTFNNVKTSFLHQGRFDDLYMLSDQIVSNIKPKALDYSEKNNMSILTIYFEEKFNTLEDFSIFDKKIEQSVKDFIAPDVYDIKIIKKSDFAKLEYKATISIYYHLYPEKNTIQAN